MSQALVPLREPTFIAQRSFFNFLGITCRILSPAGELLYFVKLKAFKLKEDITIFADEAQTKPLIGIKARSILDFSASYDVVDITTSQKVGAFRRKGMRSILRDEWEILDANDVPFGTIQEDSMALALFRRFLMNLIPQNFTITVHGAEVGTLRGTWNPFIVKFDVDVSPDTKGALDRRLALAGAVLLLTIEGKQQ